MSREITVLSHSNDALQNVTNQNNSTVGLDYIPPREPMVHQQ